jgi:hypothetical protein
LKKHHFEKKSISDPAKKERPCVHFPPYILHSHQSKTSTRTLVGRDLLTFQVNLLATAKYVNRVSANTIPIQTALMQIAAIAVQLISETQLNHGRQH